ncbi:MAG: phosphate transporter, inner rane subunit PstA [Clostridiales bacterium]|nr:phosphate transporter, inner rane subunit PstA [Clostridiales bacterium]
MKLQRKKLRISDLLIKTLIKFCAFFTIAMVVYIMGYIFVRGIPAINTELLTTAPSELKGTVGILPMIINTIYIIVVTLVVTTPISIGAAIYLSEYSKKNNKFVKVIEFTTQTLAGIPSIIFGLFGFVFFGVFLKMGYSLLSGALTLAIMVMPTIVRTTQEALKTVPNSYREGAIGLGATRLYLIRTILLPSALPGIMTSIILSIGRIVGESAALIFTAGIGYMLPKGFFTHLRSSGATLTVQLYQYAMRGENLEITYAIASVLMIIVLIINFAAKKFAAALKKG